MSKHRSAEFMAQFMPPDDEANQRRMAWFRAVVEYNKTRRRRGDPPAALPVPAGSPKGGGWSGGAAAALAFDED
jgi:hypothetical protein